jgi:Tannase and feruloyl esterase
MPLRFPSALLPSLLCAVFLATPLHAGEQARKSAATDCGALTSLRLPDVKVTGAAPGDTASAVAVVKVPHCKVTGVIGTEIRFEVLLPDDWNGRFAMGGGGGFVGSVQNQAAGAVNAGYASAGTDTGHQDSGIQASWALDHLERQINYGYLGVHRTAEVARAIVRAYYGQDASHAYFVGCSNGGRQALMEAQRFPSDFDGIVSGAPAYDFTSIAAAFINHAQATFPDPHHLTISAVSPDALKTVAAAALEACDAKDGVTDGVIGDPSSCHFSLDRVATCPGPEPAAGCLTATERKALARIYEPTRGADGEIYPGQPPGGEAEDGGWRQWITGVDSGLAVGTHGKYPSLQYAFGTEFFKYFVFQDESWDYTRYDVAEAPRDTRQAATFLNADAADLSAFKTRGGRLVVWHGWADPALNARSTITYYKGVEARDAAVRDYARLFLLPGVLHCGGGPGPDGVDWLAAIVDWVEHGKAPERLVASKNSNGTVVRTRPVCPYPLEAVYNGTGSTDDEASFTCKPR